jgi:spermidine/putrescine transport system permease protein
MIHRLSGAWRIVALALILAPLFMSYIVKLYALRSLFGSNGYVAQALAALGLDVPVTWLLFNQTAVFMTMAIVYLPFAVVPIFLTLEKVPANLSAAAADLGARPGQIFWRVVFPRSLPGTVAGGLFVFILVLGDFVTPQMMGGTRGFTYGKLVFSQFGLAYEWPFGAAMSVVLLIVSLLVILVAALIARRGAVSL